MNTDRELYRDADGNSIHVTEGGGIGINVGGLVMVRPLCIWHEAMAQTSPVTRKMRHGGFPLDDPDPPRLPRGSMHNTWND